MNKTYFITLVLIGLSCYLYTHNIVTSPVSKKSTMKRQSDIYQFMLPCAEGGSLKLSDFKGKVLLIVNTAVQCGFKSQYKGLEELYQRYKDQGLVIIAVSSDDFNQEIADAEERACAIDKLVKTTFLMTDTVHVIDRKGKYAACPLYRWLNKQGAAKSWFGFGAVQWNFHKFLIGRSGEFIDWFAASTSPLNKKVTRSIEKALAK